MTHTRTVLVVGSGGREHALAWKLAQSPRVDRVIVAPGNGGTTWAATPGRASCETADVKADDIPGLVALATATGARLTVVGPEVPLAAGITDRFQAAGLRCFGPRAAAAKLEASKAFAKAFMERNGIPTAAGRSFTDPAEAREWLEEAPFEVVVKASGLAGGKGVLIPADRAAARAAVDQIAAGAFGAAGEEIIVEERLEGPEVSLLAFTDGQTVAVMPPAQDHKRALDGDEGLNTGGMGAYAPAPALDDVAGAAAGILQRAVDGMRAEGTPYVGVLYAGLMLTADGPRTLEFNCRLGDPETQVLLPLLETDLVDVIDACLDGTLASLNLRWSAGAAATVVAASRGYPGRSDTGKPISGIPDVHNAVVFHAGTTRDEEGGWITSGGRVLAVTGTGATLHEAVNRAYAGIDRVEFDGKHLRRDIAHRALGAMSYADAGVDLEAGAATVQGIKAAVQSTHGPEVLAGVGAFGGMFSAAGLKAMAAPVLVASTDGVGTKTKLGTRLGRLEGLGHDIVNHCINDILVQGARPLFFLDYVASSTLEPAQVVSVVRGAAAACRAAGCALLGGETAEMPGVYQPGELDIVGTIVGTVDRSAIVDGQEIRVGDALIALRSDGLHTNGYSLARRIVAGLDLDAPVPELGESLADALLRPHRSYLPEVDAVQGAGVQIRGMAHITGGGLYENLPRVLSGGLRARVEKGSWSAPPVFAWLARAGRVAERELHRTFNMGIGMILVVDPAAVATACAALSAEGLAQASVIGNIVDGPGDTVELV